MKMQMTRVTLRGGKSDGRVIYIRHLPRATFVDGEVYERVEDDEGEWTGAYAVATDRAEPVIAPGG